MIKTILEDFVKFLKKPDDLQINLSVKNKIYFTLILLVFGLIISHIFIIPVLLEIDKVVPLSYHDNNYTFLQIFLFLVIITPFFEELIFRYFLRYERIKTKIISLRKWRKIFPYLVYFFAICFALAHISNYSNNSTLFFILSPIIISSQFITGLIITFLRVRLNFFWGVLFHCTWNFLVLIAIPFVEDLLSIY